MKKIFVLLVCAIACIIVFGCRAPVMESSSTLSTITMTLPQTFFANSATTSSERVIMNSSGGTIALKVTASDMDTVTSTFTLSEDSYIASVSIPQGYKRTFTVTAKDAKTTTYAQGSTTVDISGTAQSIELTLKPVATVDPNISLFFEDYDNAFQFMSSDNESAVSENIQTMENKVYVFPFTFYFPNEIGDLINVSLKVVDSVTDTTIASGTTTWAPTAEYEVYYVLLTKTDTTYYFCVTQEDGTELVNWSEEVSDGDFDYDSDEWFEKTTYPLGITSENTNDPITFSISKWVKITLDSNNGSNLTSTITLYEGQTVSSINLTPDSSWAKDKCYFAGWTTSIAGDADATTYGYTPGSATYPSTTMPVDDQRFYAIWMPNYLKVQADYEINEYDDEGTTTTLSLSELSYALVVTGIDADKIGTNISSSTTSITIPEGVTAIGNQINLMIPEGVPTGLLFADLFPYDPDSSEHTVNSEYTELHSISLPDSLKTIGAMSFYNCYPLTTITIPDNVSTIGFGAFASTGISKITIPVNITSIGDHAFDGCTSLTSITLKPTIPPAIGEFVFGDVSYLNFPLGLEVTYKTAWEIPL